MQNLLEYAKKLYALDAYTLTPAEGHEGGRNMIFTCSRAGEKEAVLRFSLLNDRGEQEYLAETEFVHYLASNGAPVADVLPSLNGKQVESCPYNEGTAYISLFAFAKGMLISDNGYRYRENAPLAEYFYNTGKTLGKIHRLSKGFTPCYARPRYFDKYNMDYIHRLIPDAYAPLKESMAARLEDFRQLPADQENFGLVHFDYSDGNYHIDMENSSITVFDFDNCINCWYMFDLANLWTHGEGWFRWERDAGKRAEGMHAYFRAVLEGYRSETEISDEMLEKLPLFIDMVLIENIVDEFECCAREGEAVDFEDIENAARCLTENIPYAGLI